MEFFCFNISSFGREIARCGGYSFALFRLGKDFQIYVHITLITDKLFFATKKRKENIGTSEERGETSNLLDNMISARTSMLILWLICRRNICIMTYKVRSQSRPSFGSLILAGHKKIHESSLKTVNRPL